MEYIFSIIITIVVYMIVPIIICLAGARIKKRTIIIIVIANGIIGFFLFRLIQLSTGTAPTTNTSPAFIWSCVNYWLLKKQCLINDSYSEVDKKPNNGNSINNITYTAEANDLPSAPKVSSNKMRYCKYCGGLINNTSKKCTECGRQYFRFKSVLKVLFAFAVIVMCIGVLYYFLPECKYCPSKVFITQEYYVKGELTCRDCYSSSANCGHCYEKHRNGRMVEGKSFCQDCIASGVIMRCSECGRYHFPYNLESDPKLSRSKTIYGSYCKDCKDKLGNIYCATDFESAWGKLIECNNGELVYETLTAEQQDLVNYPYLDTDCVYWVVDGEAYHSVRWCYTLDRSENVFSSSLETASNRYPCSKCVGY